MDLYILELENKTVIGKPKDMTSKEWGDWKEEHVKECQVARDVIYGVEIKTYFRGCDPADPNPYDVGGRVFVTEVKGYLYGSKTWEQAEEWHERMCNQIRRQVEHDERMKAREQSRKVLHRR